MIDQDEAARSAGKWGREKRRESERSWASEEGGRLHPEEGRQRVLEGMRRGDSGYWSDCKGRQQEGPRRQELGIEVGLCVLS